MTIGSMRVVITYTEFQNGRYSNMMKMITIDIDNTSALILSEDSSYKGMCGEVVT